jgi:predicted short-subunit dehydrogenase-like oxidoreductase (DUF2520 family)
MVIESSDSYNIVIIGAGNVATHISRHFFTQGHRVQCVYSREPESAEKLADELGTLGTSDPDLVPVEADFFFLCVPDSAVMDVVRRFRDRKGIWIHTAGALSMELFHGIVEDFGVLYPLQSLSKERKIRIGHIPFLVEGSSPLVLELIKNLACSISEKVVEADFRTRLLVHLAAVFANNFSNHMVYVAQQILEEAELDPSLLEPLLEETFQKLKELEAYAAQTGPAVRGDRESMNKHVELLKAHPEWEKLYTFISRDIERARE